MKNQCFFVFVVLMFCTGGAYSQENAKALKSTITVTHATTAAKPDSREKSFSIIDLFNGTQKIGELSCTHEPDSVEGSLSLINGKVFIIKGKNRCADLTKVAINLDKVKKLQFKLLDYGNSTGEVVQVNTVSGSAAK